MFLPIRSDRPLRSTPWMNYLLIAANVVVFIASRDPSGRLAYSPYWLNPTAPSFIQFITYQFHHAGWQHLLMNMVFLYVFGNHVEDRLGKLGYLLFYLAGGVLAGLGHSVLENAPVLGASGAVAGVSGCYLAWFPVSNITIAYWFLVIGTFEVSGMMLILFQIGQDAVMYLGHFGGVAYLAHLSGYAYGFGIGMVLLWLGAMPREPYDFLALVQQHRRRRQFQTLTRDGYQPWLHSTGPAGGRDAGSYMEDEKLKKVMDLRARINDAVAGHKIETAATLYTDLLEVDSRQVMGQQQQLDIANQLMAQGQYEWAAKAYELFLNAYKGYTQHGRIELILGLIYGRYLKQYSRARQLLDMAGPHLMETADRDLAQEVLSEIAGRG